MSKVLVTGGSGFIGSAVVSKLAQDRSTQVIVFDSRPPAESNAALGTKAMNQENNHDHNNNHYPHDDQNGIKYIKGDVRDLGSLEIACSGVDSVIHLAALIDAADSAINPLPYIVTNNLGTMNVLAAAVENKVRNFVLASTAAVYGDCKRVPTSEQESLLPISPYGWSKVYAEQTTMQFRRDFGLDAKILRLFNVYGPNAPSSYAGVIKKFIKAANTKQNLHVFGDGEQIRDFVSVKDVASAFKLAIETEKGGGSIKESPIYNIGTGVGITINELARTLLDQVNENLSVVHDKPREGDIRDSCADIRRAISELGFMPQVSLRDGLRELYEIAHRPMMAQVS